MAYLVAPGTFDSAHVVGFAQGLPDAVKYLGKFILALPFTFHSFNGLRHLAWDVVKCAYEFWWLSLDTDYVLAGSYEREGMLRDRIRCSWFYGCFDSCSHFDPLEWYYVSCIRILTRNIASPVFQMFPVVQHPFDK